MIIKDIHIDRRYVPKWNGNKELPASEQVVINFNRIPAISERMNYKNFVIDQAGGWKISYNDNQLISAFVGKIENLETESGKKIKDGKDLATSSNPIFAELISEIRDYLFPDNEDFTEGESKA